MGPIEGHFASWIENKGPISQFNDTGLFFGYLKAIGSGMG